jgi:hypothetical protein
MWMFLLFLPFLFWDASRQILTSCIMLMSGKHAGCDPSHRARYGATTQVLQLYEVLRLYEVKDKRYKTDVDAGVYAFTTATQVFGRFGTGAWNLLKLEGRVCKETLVHNTLLHLSVALCHGNCWVLRKGLHELTKATWQFQRDLLHPTADLVA